MIPTAPAAVAVCRQCGCLRREVVVRAARGSSGFSVTINPSLRCSRGKQCEVQPLPPTAEALHHLGAEPRVVLKEAVRVIKGRERGFR